MNEIDAAMERDLRLKFNLEECTSRLKEAQEDKEHRLSLIVKAREEIYQLIGSFIMIHQGVMPTAVSQATQLTCHNCWGPFALSLLASITALFGVCNKFHNVIVWKRVIYFLTIMTLRYPF